MPIFFASDFHLGVDARLTSRQREREVVAWLDYCAAEGAEAIYLVGDLFEFWFEWRKSVPRGYVRFLGKLAELTDAGIPVHVFSGNHDMWLQSYLVEETGVRLYHAPVTHTLYGREVLIGHGDGLGPGDHGYKRLKRLINARWSRWLYARLHPNFSVGLATYFSGQSRASQPSEETFRGAEQEWLVAYSERKLTDNPDLAYCIFGHRHLAIDYLLANGSSRYINLGEWLHAPTYLRMESGRTALHAWKNSAPAPATIHRNGTSGRPGEEP